MEMGQDKDGRTREQIRNLDKIRRIGKTGKNRGFGKNTMENRMTKRNLDMTNMKSLINIIKMLMGHRPLGRKRWN